MAEIPDHYAALSVVPDSDATVIRAAFKALMLKYHPDTNGSPDATQRAMEINAAWSVLGNPRSRACYDRLYHESRARTAALHISHYQPALRPESAFATRRRRRFSQGLGSWLAAGLALAILPVAIARGSDREQIVATGNVAATIANWPGAF